MAGKMRSTNVPLSFAPLGLFSSAFKCCFQTGASPRPLKRGGLEDSSSNYTNHPFQQMSAAEVREAQAEVVT